MENYDINRPWNSLDDWQKNYIFNTDANDSCFLLCGRQVGKTTAMSIKAVELCVNHFKQGEYILICSITEKQAYHMLTKALVYAEAKYSKYIVGGKDKPTMHKIKFKNGTGILCFASGDTGEGLRGFTIKKLMIDEGSRMNDEFFVAVSPMLSVVKGSMDIASTPCGKVGFFYKCSLDDTFKKFYVSAEDCPRHTKEFLDSEKMRLSYLSYAQEYLAVFTDELKRLFNNDLISSSCCLFANDVNIYNPNYKYYLGVDVAALGNDDNSYQIVRLNSNNKIIEHIANFNNKRKYSNEVTTKIFDMEERYHFKKIGVDDNGVGFGVFSGLMDNDRTKRKVVALNNASRATDKEEGQKKLLKEEMYFTLLRLMENNQIKLLKDDEVKSSLASVQYEIDEITKKLKIFGSNTHIVEGLIRAVWLCEKEKSLNVFIHRF